MYTTKYSNKNIEEWPQKEALQPQTAAATQKCPTEYLFLKIS